MMIPIQKLLNKIKWNKTDNPKDYVLYYYDRVEDKLIPLKYADIIRNEDNFLRVEREGKEVYIPLHRIKKVAKKNQVIWKREV